MPPFAQKFLRLIGLILTATLICALALAQTAARHHRPLPRKPTLTTVYNFTHPR